MLLLSRLQKRSSNQLCNTIEMSLLPNDKYGDKHTGATKLVRIKAVDLATY